MEPYKVRLAEKIRETRSPLCLGIDLHVQNLPPYFQEYQKKHGQEAFVKSWVQSLLRAAEGALPAVKFQSSFFEAAGSSVYKLLPELVSEASQRGLLTILDVKRSDIASTMRAYGTSAFEEIKADAMTVIPYMGLDVFRPLYPWMEKGFGVYSVYLSSNPSGFEKLSHKLEGGRTVADHFHRDLFLELEEKNLSSSCGLVIGAPSYQKEEESLSSLRDVFPFLLPGLGFQGGEITKSFLNLVRKGSAHLFPLSRSLSAVGDPSLSSELTSITGFNRYEEFVSERITSFQKAFLDLEAQ